ncbi:hypothetical protein OQ483_24590 (plasmid) [Enterobacter bugandensis]|uniref:hypothetical protein n=1 Tax=Enterobacter bugandensis TaxID=881260 RepID=UPI00283A985E|nr:hypothetical protein [Enterobacter bugandensis]WMU75288.1 hypothetical protein OQ483_24590 [Enterobacter bugandensis]
MRNAKPYLNSSLFILVLTSLALPFTSSADSLKTQDIKLNMDAVCRVKLTPEGDVYATGYNFSDKGKLLYKVLQKNFSSIHEGAIESPGGGEVSCSDTDILPGKDDDFFMPVQWVLYYDGGYDSTGYVHRVKFKEKKNSVVFKTDDIDFDKVFLGKDMTRLYVSSYRTWSNDRHSTHITEINLDNNSVVWEDDFLLASRGSIVSPDKSMIYLISEHKADIVSLPERRVVGETPHFIDGIAPVIDKNGDIYGTRYDQLSQPKLTMAKIQPFSSSPDKLLWQAPYAESSTFDTGDAYKKLVPGTDGAIYVNGVSKTEGAGILVFDPKSERQKSFIPFPTENADAVPYDVSPVLFDKNTGQGYSFSYSLKESENGVERSYTVWSFSPETEETKIMSTFNTGNYLPKVFNFINNKLVIFIKDTLHILPLGTASEEYADTGQAISGTLPEEQGTPLHSHRHITWQVSAPDGESLDSGSLTLPAADPDMLGITAWPLRLAEAINRSGGALKAGEMENGVITPLASSYRNHFWLPESGKWQGATVRLTFLPSETADEKWRLNNRDDSALPVSLVTSEQSALPEKMVFQLSGKKSGAGSTLEIDGLNTTNRFTWALDVARKVNAKSDVVKLGELSADGGQSVSPLASQYRNRLWIASDGDVEVTGCTPAVFCQAGN